MADQENNEKSGIVEGQTSKRPGLVAQGLPWLITALAVVAFAAGGFVVGRLFGTRGDAQTADAAQAGPGETAPLQEPSLAPDTGEGWYYDMEPVVVNLNEPGVTRYVRVGLTLEISKTMSEKDGTAFLDQKKPLLKHWLTLFLANQTTADMRGEKNLLRLQAQISDAFNEGLFPGKTPCVKRVLFKELSIT